MPQEPEIIEYFDGPVAALVIGISEYLHGVTPEKNKAVSLEEDEFPNLQYAHKDAEKFAAFLQKKGVSELTLLTNKEATRPNIITGFKKLRTYCAELKKHYENSDGKMKPPLIVVFFSGHGWADPSNEHYLVPYEAERNRLEETALSNKDLKTNLEKLDTEKLVVFLDACHS
jgi:helicase